MGVTLCTDSRLQREKCSEKIGAGKAALSAARGLGSHNVPVTPCALSKLYWSVSVPKMRYGYEVTPVSNTNLSAYAAAWKYHNIKSWSWWNPSNNYLWTVTEYCDRHCEMEQHFPWCIFLIIDILYIILYCDWNNTGEVVINTGVPKAVSKTAFNSSRLTVHQLEALGCLISDKSVV